MYEFNFLSFSKQIKDKLFSMQLTALKIITNINYIHIKVSHCCKLDKTNKIELYFFFFNVVLKSVYVDLKHPLPPFSKIKNTGLQKKKKL